MESIGDLVSPIKFIDVAEDISIAIELKFLIPFLPYGRAAGKLPRGTPIREAEYIKDMKDIEDIDRVKLWKDTFNGVAGAIKGVPGQDAITSFELLDRREQEREYWASKWIVKESKSAEPAKDDPDSNRFVWVPVEINSPKMAWRHADTLQIIEAVLKKLTATYHMVSNHSCELHVHVGRLDGRPFSLASMKRIAILLWMAEPPMRRVKDPRSPNFDHTYTWSFALRDHSRLAKGIREARIPQVRTRRGLEGLDHALVRYLQRRNVMHPEHQKAIGYIWRATSYVELGRMMSGEDRPHRRLGFNFSAMGEEDERARSSPKTLECRFLEGVIEEGLIVSWVKIFGSIVQVGLDGHDAEGRFARSVLRLAEENGELPFDEAFRRLMADLGIDEETSRPVQALIRKIHSEGP
ncbi:hypothetical protein DL769_009577 [Monosporascus sp. CRB-8-3]|nr:hypothetical protein DL769_009577 [Monosporascus sp. CRB-8-3]